MGGKFDPGLIKLDFEDKPTRKGKTVSDFDLQAELEIDPTELDKELIEQPSKFAWVASLHEHAKDMANQLKSELEELKAELDTEVRIKAAEEETKVTEAMVKNLVLQDDRYKFANEAYLAANRLANLLGVGREAFNMRANMLISLSANKRMELDTEISSLADIVKKKRGQKD